MVFLKDLRVLIRSYCVFLFVFLFHRSIFWILFKDSSVVVNKPTFLKSWSIGFRFDLRIITLYLLVGVVIFFALRILLKLLLKLFPIALERSSNLYRKFQMTYMVLGLLFFTVVFWVDIGNYSYLEERLTSKIFALLSSPKIALGMVAQSYPIYIIIPFLMGVVLLFIFLTSKVIFSDSLKMKMSFFPLGSKYAWPNGFKFLTVFIIMIFFIHAKFSQYPLRWSESYFAKNHFVTQFSLNPIQNIFDTYKFTKINYSYDTIKDELNLVAKEMGINNFNNKLLVRKQVVNPILELKNIKNVVVIMMESLAAFKLGAYGNPLNTTPNFDALVSESLLYENFHVIGTGTASSIFCFITGIPDLNEEETASRNPLIVDQYTMINNFKNHEKFYLIGGDANWGNIRGVITNNIEDVNLLEEKDFVSSSKTDIWGISDLELFKQSHQYFEEQENPFFAFIQTAGYHRPYTIPKLKDDFEMKEISEKQIKNYGFASNDEYNALRFSDYALGRFFEMAKSSEYYKDTLFAVYADHGLRSYNAIQLSQFYKKHFFTVSHIPFLIHSSQLPKRLKGYRDSTLGYQPDMLATIQSMLGVEGLNSGFGLDLRSEEAKKRKGIFLKGGGAYPVRFFDGDRLIESGLEEDTKKIRSFRTTSFLRQLKAISSGDDGDGHDGGSGHDGHDSGSGHNGHDSGSGHDGHDSGSGHDGHDSGSGHKNEFLNQEEAISAEIANKAALGRAYLKAIKYKLKNNQKKKIGSWGE